MTPTDQQVIALRPSQSRSGDKSQEPRSVWFGLAPGRGLCWVWLDATVTLKERDAGERGQPA